MPGQMLTTIRTLFYTYWQIPIRVFVFRDDLVIIVAFLLGHLFRKCLLTCSFCVCFLLFATIVDYILVMTNFVLYKFESKMHWNGLEINFIETFLFKKLNYLKSGLVYIIDLGIIVIWTSTCQTLNLQYSPVDLGSPTFILYAYIYYWAFLSHSFY